MSTTHGSDLGPRERSLRRLERPGSAAWGRVGRPLSHTAGAEGLGDVSFERHDSPLGSVLLGATGAGLLRVGLPGEDEEAVLCDLAEPDAFVMLAEQAARAVATPS